MDGQLAFGFVISFIQTAFGQERRRCPFEFIDAGTFCVSCTAVIGILAHVEQHEFESFVRGHGAVARGTPLFLRSRDTDRRWWYVFVGLRSLERFLGRAGVWGGFIQNQKENDDFTLV